MQDPFLNNNRTYHQGNMEIDTRFPDYNTRWVPRFEDDAKTKFGKSIEKGTEITKKAFHFIIFGFFLATLLILIPPFGRLMYEFSQWAFELAGNIFP